MHPARTLAALVLGLGLALLPGCGDSRSRTAPGPEPPAVAVRVETARMEPVPVRVEAMGTVRARATTSVTSQVQGHVAEVAVREGERVRPGDLLVRLDEAEAAAGLARAEAARAAASHAREEAARAAVEAAAQEAEARAAVAEGRSALVALARAVDEAEAARAGAASQARLAGTTLERYRQMYAERALAPQEYDEVVAREQGARAELARADARLAAARAMLAQQEARLVRAERGAEAAQARRGAAESRTAGADARVREAEADAARARVHLGYTRVTAPGAGLVVAKTVEVGDLAVPGRPLLRLDDASAYRLEVPLASSWASRVRPGQAVAVVIDDLGPAPLHGQVAEVLPEADPATRTVTVKVGLPPAPGLRTGQSGTAWFEAGQAEALRVPTAAAVERGQLTGVFVVEGGNVARLRLVTLGARADDRVEVLSGLRAGEAVVVAGVEQLGDGARVRVGP
jgi:RND family efflux transporter MFP subunit